MKDDAEGNTVHIHSKDSMAAVNRIQMKRHPMMVNQLIRRVDYDADKFHDCFGQARVYDDDYEKLTISYLERIQAASE